MENKNQIFDTVSCTGPDPANSFLPALEGSCQGLSHNSHLLDTDWTGHYRPSHDKITAPFFEIESGLSTSKHIYPLRYDTQTTPEVMSDNHGTPHNWSSIDLNLVAQTGQNIQNATFNLNPTLTTEGGTACHGKVLSRSHHTSRSGSEAATDGPRYQRSKRVSHYRIEKKYRTNINDKIRLLNEMLPENLQCAQLCMDTEREDINIATTKSKAAAKRSKGDVLSLVIDYIVFLQKKDLLQKQRIQDLEDCLWTSKHWSFE